MTADVPTTRAISEEAVLAGVAARGEYRRNRAALHCAVIDVDEVHWILTAALPHLAQSSDEAAEALQVAERATGLVERYGSALIVIAGHLQTGTKGGVMRARTVIAGLDLDDAPAQSSGRGADHAREVINGISSMIDASYPPGLGAESHRWRRCMKVAEEVGEVTEALLGMVGENPRKGMTHGIEDLHVELLDVALAALGAVAYLEGNAGDPVLALTNHAATVLDRLRAALAADEVTGR